MRGNKDQSLGGYSKRDIKTLKVYLALVILVEIALSCLAVTKGYNALCSHEVAKAAMLYGAPFAGFIVFSIIGRLLLNRIER